MQKIAKAFHVIGVAAFLGSILGHAIGGLAENVNDSAAAQLVGRQIIDVATWYLTIPGLVLLSVSGLYIIVQRGWLQLKMRWLVLHLVIGTLILLNAFFILMPTGQGILEAVVNGDDLKTLHGREALFGAINIVLSLVTIFIAVIKPRLVKKEV